MTTAYDTKPTPTVESPTLISRVSMASSVVALLIALADISAVLIIHFFKLPVPVWANQAQQLAPESAVVLGTVGVLFNLIEAATILARHETFDPKDASKQYAMDDAETILARFERGCLMRVTVPFGLILGLASLLLGLLPLPGTEWLQVFADNAPQACATSSALAPFSLQVVNSSSWGSVGWSAQPVEQVGGAGWAQISPSTGTLAPGHRTIVQVIPNVLLCQYLTERTSTAASAGHGYAAVNDPSVPAAATYHVAVTDATAHRTTTVDMSVLGSASTVHSGPTVTPASAKLSVGPTGTTSVNCFGSSVAYPKITIGNTGGKTLNWSASTTVSGASLSSGSGLVAPGGSQQVSVSQGGPTSTATNVNISSNGGSATVSFTCIPPSASLKVTQNQNASESCSLSASAAAAYTVKLDNTGSNVTVGWQFNASSFGSWANAAPASGAVSAGATATFQVNPATCAAPGATHTYQAMLNLSFPQGGSQSDISLTDAITTAAVVVNFNINPSQASWNCQTQGQPPAVAVTLDNTGSNVAVNWSAAMENPYAGAPLSITSATSGTIPANSVGQMTVTPNNTVDSANPEGYTCDSSYGLGAIYISTYTFDVTVNATIYKFVYTIYGYAIVLQ